MSFLAVNNLAGPESDIATLKPMMPINGQDVLYVLQNEHGSYKVGRTWSVKRRIYEIQRSDVCKIFPIFSLNECGPWEVYIHNKIRKHVLLNEWFKGNDESRMDLQNLLETNLIWRTIYNQKDENKWLKDLELSKMRRYTVKLLQYEIRYLNDTERNKLRDYSIIDFVSKIISNDVYDRVLGTGIAQIFREEERKRSYSGKYLIPDFTIDVDSALLLWPNDIRPDYWHGSAIETSAALLRYLRCKVANPHWDVRSCLKHMPIGCYKPERGLG
ncbi:GIY-YIG nuclease family protein [Sphingomonas sp. CL5.1]|uniref:GIY-YIG nuclease family protein n=1 Tax=Sphingomonas sp. CL5.1 TaxID=2653203 RepID=UPI0015817C27|nr:GIY-YIG nuclease family protein [Sphingomonas sp. CL5.1]QKR98698.1 GIY-YIG nuclease family protein [Sphingomonas sp. CL5.1]